MQFREEVKKLLDCKASGICTRDKLVSVYLAKLIEGGDADDSIGESLLNAKTSDDNFVIKILEQINDD
jgi:hypothetical protein